jgi:hypothetical protein
MYNVGLAESKMIGVAVHNQDPMAVAAYDSGSAGFPNFTGYPYAASDRAVGAHAASIQTSFNARKNEVPPASISFTTATASTATNNIVLTPKATMVTTLSGDYRMGVIVVEDHVKGTGTSWLQVNAFSGGTSSIPHGTQNWQTLPNPTDVSTVFGGYDHVGRALGDNLLNGAAGSLPATMTDGMSYSHTYTIAINSAWNLNNLHAVAYFVNNTTGEVLNAGSTPIVFAQAGLEEETFNFGTKLYPNPNTGLSNLLLTLNNESTVSMEVVDIVGNVVMTVNEANLGAGEHNYNINLVEEASGVYFAKVNVNGVTKTIKLNVAK